MRKVTLDDVARLPRPGTAIPGSFAFSPDGKTLTFLHSREESMSRVLWAHDIASGETRVLFDPGQGVTDDNVSPEEALRRERQRIMHSGVTHYAWAADADVMIVPLGGEVWFVTADGDARKVCEGATDARLSPDGRKVAFVRAGDLYVHDGSTELRLTDDAEPGVTNGLAEFIAQEELGRSAGLWWSKDGTWIAYERADERHIPDYVIPHWGTDHVTVETHRYPFAGAENVRWQLGIVPDAGGETTWLDTVDAEYLARAAWHPDGRLFVQTLTRDQRELALRAYAPLDTPYRKLLVEASNLWINLHDDLRFIEKTGEFIWASERSGTKQLELRAPDGALIREVTNHSFPIDAVAGVDQEARRVAYTAAVTPTESQVFVVSLDGGEPEHLTKAGVHAAVFSKDLSVWVDLATSGARAPSVTFFAPDERVLHPPAEIELALCAPELFTFEARDGETLHGMLYRPETLPAPLIVRVYGGPHAQMVGDAWSSTCDLPAQYLAQEGFAVLSVDNRGSSRRGLAFEGAIARRMGTIEVDDQVDGVRFARSEGWVDGDRAGMIGWSYGGYMTIMSMLKAPDVFLVGVAGAPVTDWAGYDTGYTERYMSTPQHNPDGYREGSALAHAANLRGKLLVIHGMLDENVHFRHTARFLDALAKANRSCDLFLYPNERHSPRSEADRRAMHERIVGYFKEHL